MDLKKKPVAIIQARFNSTRLPGKVLKKINNKTMLEILIRRLSRSKYISKIIVACSKNEKDKNIIDICKNLEIDYFIGSENDVLERYYKAAKKFKALNIVRITGDCPLIDPKVVDEVIINFFKKNVDYASNGNPPTYPDGLDVEVFRFSALQYAFFKAKHSFEREHVTPFIVNHKKFTKFNLKYYKNISSLRLTLDEKEDLFVLEKIIKNFENNIYFDLKNILDFLRKNKKIISINSHIKRNEGYHMNLGQKMWKRANKIIPGGTMLFSKNPDLFLPKFWPAYFEKTKGCTIWDLEKKKYLDLSYMGVGTNILGYCRKEIDDSIKDVIRKGNMSTLNSKEEILLAEKLVDMHPWSSMAKFTRTGGEASAVAIRIARAASGKDNIAVCGYHGWHDWYLSANLTKTNSLSSHLMDNLPINGISRKLKNSVFSFEYNNFNQLKNIIQKNNIGTVIMEVSRNERPKDNFLMKVRLLTKQKNIVLIFDECTSGFRETFGGLHLKLNVNPDIALFGKALGNGYAINAIIGSYEVMQYANSSFISSTFWTERIGSVAALETLKIMEKIKSWEIISSIGCKIKENWKKIANENKLKIKIEGLDALPRFIFKSSLNSYYKTYISQEFLKKNFLAGNSVYVCTEHSKEIINRYFEILNNIFFNIRKINNTKKSFKLSLDGPICKTNIRDKKN